MVLICSLNRTNVEPFYRGFGAIGRDRELILRVHNYKLFAALGLEITISVIEFFYRIGLIEIALHISIGLTEDI
jgi:hypothetical protein